MHIDRLEARRMLTVYTVTGSSGRDTIELDYNGSTVTADVNGLPVGNYPGFLVTGIVVEGLGANDTIRVNDTLAGIPYTLKGGAGDDIIDVRNTDGPGVVIEGGDGSDSVRVNDDLIGPAIAAIRATDAIRDIQSQPGGLLRLENNAGVLVESNTSNIEGDVDIGSGFLIERGSQSVSGLGYYRSRIVNGLTGNPGAKVTSSFASGSGANDGIGLGYAQDIAPLNVGGFALQNGDLVMRYALAGDANLDGTVGFADLLALSQNYETASNAWTKGDFDYDGQTSFGDLLGLSQNYGQSALRGATDRRVRGMASQIV